MPRPTRSSPNPGTARSPSRAESHASSATDPSSVATAQRALLEGVGAEIAASFPGVTRLGGQIVAALYLSDGPVSMDELSLSLGRSKSNIFGNLKHLEAAGIVERQRVSGERFDAYGLRGKYPDVIIGAYLARLRRVVADKRALSQRALALLGDARGKEADALRTRLHDLSRKYDRFGVLFEAVLPGIDGPFDLEAFLDAVPVTVISVLSNVARRVAGLKRSR
ncbi:MAG TPA: MarR family transcriptional regulator [Polyangiaceae bacterium]|nr:MarR family transcriptional regulator [Polyangiaceae bacterium]